MITVQNEDRQAGPGRGADRWPGMYRGAWTRLDSALQLYFYDGHPRAGSGICSGFLSEKVDTEEHLDGKQPFVSALCAAWAETMLDLRTFVRSPAPSGAFMEILPFLSRYEQR